MKKHLLLTLGALAMMVSAKAEPQKIEEISRVIEESTEAIKETLNKPVIVLSADNDTIFSNVTDSVSQSQALVIHAERTADGAAAIDDKAASTELFDEDDYSKYRIHTSESRDTARLIALSIIAPCAIIALIVICLFVFLIIKNHGRNIIISKAIMNNYQLPDSFYTGRDSSSSQNNMTSQAEPQLPPLPNQPAGQPIQPMPSLRSRFESLNYMERRQAVNAMVLMGVGLMIFLFFLCVGWMPVGFLAGGITFIIGASRLISVLYINRN